MQKTDHKVAKGKNCQNSWDDIKAEELQTIQPFSVRPLDGILLVLLLEGLITESVQSSPLDLHLYLNVFFSRDKIGISSMVVHIPSIFLPVMGLGNYFWYTSIRHKDMLHLIMPSS